MKLSHTLLLVMSFVLIATGAGFLAYELSGGSPMSVFVGLLVLLGLRLAAHLAYHRQPHPQEGAREH